MRSSPLAATTSSCRRFPFKRLEGLLGRFVDRYDQTDKYHFLAYNARFDADHLRRWFEKCGSPFFGSWFWAPPIDVMSIAAVVLMSERPKLKNFRLATVASHLGISTPGPEHDALADVELGQRVFQAVHGRVRS